MQTSNTQLRGHCQCCGRIQAVVSTNGMSKHGYTVKQGWFSGVCQGDRFAPMETSIDQTTAIVAAVRAEVLQLEKDLAKMHAGKITPKFIGTGEKVPFAEGSAYHQKEAVARMIYNTESRWRAGVNYANDMEKLAAATIGKPLQVVTKAEKPAAITKGEQRTLGSGAIGTVRYVEGARVYWQTEKGFRGWTGTQAWRKMPLVGAVAAAPVVEVKVVEVAFKPAPAPAAPNLSAPVDSKVAAKQAGYTVENMGKKYGKEFSGQYRWTNAKLGTVQQVNSKSRAEAWAECLKLVAGN